jgi:hypothetical protein
MAHISFDFLEPAPIAGRGAKWMIGARFANERIDR